jgi:hypothetical protein
MSKGWLIAVAICFALPAAAEESAAAQPTPQVATPVPATPAAPPPAEAAPAAKSEQAPAPKQESSPGSAQPATEGELDAEKIMAAQKAGYQIRNENGQTLLCRKELQTGSRVRYRTSCLTAREWKQLEADNAQMLKAIERRPRITKQ